MGNRVHVIKKHAEYADYGCFNWKTSAFKNLLDITGGDTTGEEFADNFECREENYKASLKAVALFNRVNKKLNAGTATDEEVAKLDSLLEEFSIDREELEGALNNLGGPESVLEDMVALWLRRERNYGWISFAAF